mmetsp:Transcript_93573/g.238261  ORF Transcript_93573/g.238261 Transcript_93573/m.238261 type:complete len:215 (+) Transcript_93573:64-708(+)
MRRLLGSKKEEPKAAAAPSLQEASAKIDLQVQSLEDKILQCDVEVKKLVAQGTNPTAKQRALQVLKRKKMYEQQRDQLLGTQFNVEQIAFHQEQAEITMAAAAAMKAGTEALKKQTQTINISTVDELVDDMAEITDEMNAIQEALAQQAGGVTDDADLAEEYAKMEEEMALMKLMESGSGLGAASSSAVPVGTEAVPGVPAAAVVAAPAGAEAS